MYAIAQHGLPFPLLQQCPALRLPVRAYGLTRCSSISPTRSDPSSRSYTCQQMLQCCLAWTALCPCLCLYWPVLSPGTRECTHSPCSHDCHEFHGLACLSQSPLSLSCKLEVLLSHRGKPTNPLQSLPQVQLFHILVGAIAQTMCQPTPS